MGQKIAIKLPWTQRGITFEKEGKRAILELSDRKSSQAKANKALKSVLQIEQIPSTYICNLHCFVLFRYVLKWIHAMKHFYCLIWIWNWILIDLAFGRNGFGIWYEREEVVLTKLNGKSKENTCVEKIENWGRLLNYNCQISRLGEKDCKVSKKLGKSWGEKADWTLFGLVSFSTQQ